MRCECTHGTALVASSAGEPCESRDATDRYQWPAGFVKKEGEKSLVNKSMFEGEPGPGSTAGPRSAHLALDTRVRVYVLILTTRRGAQGQ